MKSRYLVPLFGVTAFFALLSVAGLILYLTHWQFRQTVGHDKAAFDKFAARVESGSFNPETMMRFTNNWFEAQRQAHQMIQMEETVNDRLARRVLVLGVLGLLAVVFQAWVIFSLRTQ